MTRLFFLGLLAVFAIGSMLYHVCLERKRLWVSIPAIAGAALILYFAPWQLSAIGFPLMLLPIVWKTSYGNLMDSSMLGSILGAFFLYNFYFSYHVPWLIMAGIFMAVVICLLSVFGIIEEDVRRFLIISNLIQFLFVFLDISVAKVTNSLPTLGTIQIFNYAIVGTLFFLSLGMISNSMGWLSGLRGMYYVYPVNGFALIVASVSLAGVPGLNLFISEWLLFKGAFGLSPVITVVGIFAALLLFIMYIKFAYIILIGDVREKAKPAILPMAYNMLLSIVCILIGIVPWLQFMLLEAVFS